MNKNSNNQSKCLEIKNNKECEINVTNNYINNDVLSLDEIAKNSKNIKLIEEGFSKRIKNSCSIIETESLPIELQDDFSIKAKFCNNKLNYYTEAKSEDAYIKFPRRINFKMKFNTIEEKEKFIKEGGYNKLINLADEKRIPVEIPNIIEMKDYLGNYEDPMSKINLQKGEGIKLYVMPQEFPKAETYNIELFDNDIEFKIDRTNLRLIERQEKYCVLNNEESKEEPFDITLKLTIINEDERKKMLEFNINLEITIREKYRNSTYYNNELQKFKFIFESNNGSIIIKNMNREFEMLRKNNIGKIKYSQKNYKCFERLSKLLSNIVFIEKIIGINVKYDIENFYRNEDIINLVASDLKGEKYKFYNDLIITIDDKKYKGKTELEIEISIIKLFNKEFKLNNILKLRSENFKYEKKEKIDEKNIIYLRAQNIQYIP